MLSVDFLGFKLRNPLMLTEGPLSGTKELLERAANFRIGLIFTKGIRPKPAHSPVPYIRKYERSLINADWSCIGLDEWLDTIENLRLEIPVVTSIAKNYVTPDVAVEMAEKLVKAGSKIVSFVDYNPSELVKTVSIARPRLKVPIMVKLPPFLGELEKLLKALVKAGVDAIAAMDSIGPVLSIDIETGEPVMGSEDGSGYLSGRYILPVTLKYIYEISRFTNLPVVGVGGVTDYKSALQMIMAGATGVGMVSEPLLKGLKVFDKVEKDMEEYLVARGIDDIGKLKGLTHRRVAAREVSVSLKAFIDIELCNGCDFCRRVCYSLAIEKTGSVYTVKSDLCVGCGLCESVCPVDAISFR